MLRTTRQRFLRGNCSKTEGASVSGTTKIARTVLRCCFHAGRRLFRHVVSGGVSRVIPLVARLFNGNSLPLIGHVRRTISMRFSFITTGPSLPQFLVGRMLPRGREYSLLGSGVRDFFRLFGALRRRIGRTTTENRIRPFGILLLFRSVLSLGLFPSMVTGVMTGLVNRGTLAVRTFVTRHGTRGVRLVVQQVGGV